MLDRPKCPLWVRHHNGRAPIFAAKGGEAACGPVWVLWIATSGDTGRIYKPYGRKPSSLLGLIRIFKKGLSFTMSHRNGHHRTGHAGEED